jgi:hypothetical protein
MEQTIVPVEVELEDVAAAFKRLLLEVVCCAVVVVAVAVVLPAKWLTAWKVPPATPPNRTALKAMAPFLLRYPAPHQFQSVRHRQGEVSAHSCESVLPQDLPSVHTLPLLPPHLE